MWRQTGKFGGSYNKQTDKREYVWGGNDVKIFGKEGSMWSVGQISRVFYFYFILLLLHFHFARLHCVNQLSDKCRYPGLDFSFMYWKLQPTRKLEGSVIPHRKETQCRTKDYPSKLSYLIYHVLWYFHNLTSSNLMSLDHHLKQWGSCEQHGSSTSWAFDPSQLYTKFSQFDLKLPLTVTKNHYWTQYGGIHMQTMRSVKVILYDLSCLRGFHHTISSDFK